MRALVISDTHFGAWTGRDLLREDLFLERLAPQLDGIDELIFLGDLYDFLFGSVGEAVDASAGLLDLIAAKLAGGRLVFLAGNHDHHLVHRDFENRLEAQLAAGLAPTAAGEPAPAGEGPGPGFFRSFLGRRLPGVEVEIAYPTYEFAGVLLTHGHYLDPHARLAGSRGSRLLTRALWGIASGGPEDPKTIADYESTITLLTEWLYIAAQMPHGTHAQRNVFRAAQRAGRFESALKLPLRSLRRLHGEEPMAGAEEGQGQPAYPAASVISPSDPSERALEAFARVVANLGWDREAERIVFAHTHQPLADVRAGAGGGTRYWNTGSWIYEPDRSSRQAYERYLRHAWPGTAVVIDDERTEPELIELLADLNPLHGGPGLPSSGEKGRSW